MRLRAIAARLQAEYIPPLRLLPFGRTTSTASRVLSPLTGKVARRAERGPWADRQGQYLTASPCKRRSPRTGKGDRVSGGRCPWTDGKEQFPTASPHKRRSPRTGARSAGCRWHPRVWPARPKGGHGRDFAHISIYMEIASFCEPLPLQSAALLPQRGRQAFSAHGEGGPRKRWKRSLNWWAQTMLDRKSSQAA